MARPAPETENRGAAATDLPLTAKIVKALEANRFACEYQPIVRADTEEVWAYEALARFSFDGEVVPPNRVFGALRQDPTLFFMLEARVKTFQLTHRPRGVRLFVNLDPQVCEEAYQLDHWLESLRGHENLVVEIIENTSVTNQENIRRFMQRLSDVGVDAALDDIGGSQNLFSFDLLDHCHYLKLDRRWFDRLAEHPSYRALLAGLIEFARARGIHTVLEGIESRRDLSFARSLGVDFIQGFLFRDAFVTVKDVPLALRREGVPSPTVMI
ncbi:MAG: EAL domain-containing protein [Deltaproteobacteria bacterium]|nr:EAL domain-containing protein [Deltaproteobacteria bacterium]